MRSKHRAIVLPVLAALFAAGLTARTFAEDAIVVNTRSLDPEARPSLLVRVFGSGREFTSPLDGASVYLDRRRVGPAPYTAELEPGSWLVAVSAPGYADKELRLSLEKGRAYELRFSLERERGRLLVSIEPPDAELFVDGNPSGPGLLGLPSGYHSLRLRRFGYRELGTTVFVPDRGLVRADLALRPAPFEVSGLAASREVFNPANAGPLGSTLLGFSVSGPGSASLSIEDEGGEEVFRRDFPQFSTWEQAILWEGRGPGGSPLPDGSYHLRLSALSPEGRESELELELRIDSRLVARPFGLAEGLGGLRLLPLPLPIPRGLGSFELGLSSSAPWKSSTLLGAIQVSTGSLDLGLTASADLQGPGRAELGLELPLAGEGWPGPGFGLAFGAGASTEGGYRGSFDLILPLLSRLAEEGPPSRPLPFLALGSGLLLSGEPDGGPGLLGRASFGLGLTSDSWVLGLSARASSAELLRTAPAFGGAEAALEARFLLPASPLLLGLGLGGSIDAGLRPGPPWGELRLGLSF